MSSEIRDLIRQMGLANPLWGAPRLHGELLKLGIDVSQVTVGRYLPWRPKVPSPTWRIGRAIDLFESVESERLAIVREMPMEDKRTPRLKSAESSRRRWRPGGVIRSVRPGMNTMSVWRWSA
jgi:hypothetical protein